MAKIHITAISPMMELSYVVPVSKACGTLRRIRDIHRNQVKRSRVFAGRKWDRKRQKYIDQYEYRYTGTLSVITEIIKD